MCNDCVCPCVYVCTTTCTPGAPRSQKTASDPSELEWQTAMSRHHVAAGIQAALQGQRVLWSAEPPPRPSFCFTYVPKYKWGARLSSQDCRGGTGLNSFWTWRPWQSKELLGGVSWGGAGPGAHTVGLLGQVLQPVLGCRLWSKV